MPQLLLTLTCIALIAIWLFRGVPLAATPRGGPLQEAWIAFCISGLPMLLVGGVAYSQPEAIVGKGQLKFLLVSNTLAVTGSAMAVCFFGALGLRLAFARPSPFSPEQREGKRLYRCHLGGFQFLYPKAWRMSREGLLTYVFAARNPTLGVLRVSRVYHDSSMAREFVDVLADVGLDAEALLLDRAQQKLGEPSLCYASERDYDPERDKGRWLEPPKVLERRFWVLDRALVLFVIDYVYPSGLEGPELEAELRAVEELVEQLWVSRQVVADPG
jgi:hypothetical protein